MAFTTYDFIDSNKRKTYFLVAMFPIALMALTYGTFFLISLFTVEAGAQAAGGEMQAAIAATHSMVTPILAIVFVIALIWLSISYFSGGEMVLRMANAKPANPDTHKEILRMVENMSITAGLPMPKVYIVNDVSMNAFATGRNPKNAYIGLTTGLINNLEKNEIEAVIAHELAHIGNRDTTLMLIVILAVGACTLLGQILLRSQMFRGRGRGGRGGAVILILGIILLIYGYLLAPLLRLALSRRREYQADATAALITRDPQSLISALNRISGRSHLQSIEGNSLMGDICFESPAKPKKQTSSDFFSTHPAVEKRVAALQKMDGLR